MTFSPGGKIRASGANHESQPSRPFSAVALAKACVGLQESLGAVFRSSGPEADPEPQPQGAQRQCRNPSLFHGHLPRRLIVEPSGHPRGADEIGSTAGPLAFRGDDAWILFTSDTPRTGEGRSGTPSERTWSRPSTPAAPFVISPWPSPWPRPSSSPRAALWQARWPWPWPLGALVAGWGAFNCTVLLHEALHRNVFSGPSPRLYTLVEWCYALPTAISPAQFTRWHLDHHAQLGSPDLDPKRHRLSPKRNERLLKFLYFTPALFVIYFRAARLETATLPCFSATEDRPRAPRRAPRPSRPRAGALVRRRGLGRGPRLRPAALRRVPGALRPQPPGPALRRHTPGPCGLVHAREVLAAVGCGLPLVGPPPGAPRLSRRALLRPASSHAGLAPLLDRHGVPERGFFQLLWLYLAKNRPPHSDWDLAGSPTDA